MSAASILATARRRAETRMVDRGTISRPQSHGEFDPATGVPGGSGDPVLIYRGKCQIVQNRISNPTATAVGGDFPVVETVTLSLPTSVPQILPLDIFTLDEAPDHPQDVGRRFRVIAFDPSTQVKQRRYQVAAIIG